MKELASLIGALGLVLASPMIAEAAKLTFSGRVASTRDASPVEEARVTVTFHGHETGIHEYTTERRVRAYTDELGYFTAEVKVPDDRYIWTHATVEIAETERTKSFTVRASCQGDDNGGGYCTKDFQVSPLN